MADKGGDRELPQRFRGDTRAATSPSGSPAAPVLSAELRERLEAAVIAERSVAAAREQNTAQERAGAANAGPLTEDEVTEWIGTAGKSPEAAPGARRRRARCRAGICQLAGRRAGCPDRDPCPGHRVADRRGGQAFHRNGQPAQRRRGRPGGGYPPRGGGPRAGGRLGRPAGKPGRGGVLRSGDVRGARGARAPVTRPARARAAFRPIRAAPPLSSRRAPSGRCSVPASTGPGRRPSWRLSAPGPRASPSGSLPRMGPSRTRPRWPVTRPPPRRPAPGCWPTGGSPSRRPPGPSSPGAWSTCA